MSDDPRLAGPDDATRQRMVEDVQKQVAALDPNHPDYEVYKGRFQALLHRHGIVPPAAPSPQEIGLAAVDAKFRHIGIGDNLAGILDGEAERLGALAAAEREKLIANLMQQYGGEEAYRQVVRDAQAGLRPGESLKTGALASRHFLDTFAALGRANRAAEAERARIRGMG